LSIITIKYRIITKKCRIVVKGTIIKGTITEGMIIKGIIARKTIIKGVCRTAIKWAIIRETIKGEACRVIIKGLIVLRPIIKAAELFKFVFRYKIVPDGVILIIIFVKFIVNLLIT